MGLKILRGSCFKGRWNRVWQGGLSISPGAVALFDNTGSGYPWGPRQKAALLPHHMRDTPKSAACPVLLFRSAVRPHHRGQEAGKIRVKGRMSYSSSMFSSPVKLFAMGIRLRSSSGPKSPSINTTGGLVWEAL